jgi:hypothetical protein
MAAMTGSDTLKWTASRTMVSITVSQRITTTTRSPGKP